MSTLRDRLWTVIQPHVDGGGGNADDSGADILPKLEDIVQAEREAAKLQALFPAAELPPVVWSTAFEIGHEPKGKVRHHARVAKNADGKTFVQEYPDRDGERDEIAFALRASPHQPPERWLGPVIVNATYRLPIPGWAAWERAAALAGPIRPSARGSGDVDNFLKRDLDALTRYGAWWKDDAQVVATRVEKVYAEQPSERVEVYFLREPQTAAEWKASRNGGAS